MQAVIVSTGDELVSGKVIDTNSSWFANILAEKGVSVSCISIVGDDRNTLLDILNDFVGKVEVIIISGGLGPTDDDITRFVLAEMTGRRLVEDTAILNRIKAFFEERNRPFIERNKVQAMIPEGACALDNPVGTAAGIRLEYKGTTIFALPGVPHEAKVLFNNYILPWLESLRLAPLYTRKLNLFGIGESDLASRIEHIAEEFKNKVSIGTQVSDGLISVWIRSKDKAAADMCADKLYGLVGDFVFSEGDISLAEAVGRLLVEDSKSVAVAESCTGGLVGKLLTDVPGSSRYFLGGLVVYSNDAKEKILGVPSSLLAEYGAVSRECAEAMLEGVFRLFDSDFAVAITGIAGPSGASKEKPVGLVYVGLGWQERRYGRQRLEVDRLLFGDIGRDAIRKRASLYSLYMLIRRLKGHPFIA